jgi:hypothetical protein
MDILKRLFNALTILWLIHLCVHAYAIITYQFFGFQGYKDTYLKHLSIQVADQSAFYIPIIIVILNYIFFKKVTLWNNNKKTKIKIKLKKIILLVIILMSIVALVVFKKYSNNENVLFTLSCEIVAQDKTKIKKDVIGTKSDIRGVGFESGELWYVQRIHESFYNSKSESLKPEYLQIGKPDWFKPADGLSIDDYYFSGVLGGNAWFILNRANLKAKVFHARNKGKISDPDIFDSIVDFECKKISESDFKKALNNMKKIIHKNRKI